MREQPANADNLGGFSLFASQRESLAAVSRSLQVNLPSRCRAADFGAVSLNFAAKMPHLRPIGRFYGHNTFLFSIVMKKGR